MFKPEFTKTFASIVTGQQFKANLDNIHSQDLDLFEATTEEAYDAYIARFGEPAECIYFKLDFELWKRQQTYA